MASGIRVVAGHGLRSDGRERQIVIEPFLSAASVPSSSLPIRRE